MGCVVSTKGQGEHVADTKVVPNFSTPGEPGQGSRVNGTVSPAGRSLALADSSGPSRPLSPALSAHTGGSQLSLPADCESAPELAVQSDDCDGPYFHVVPAEDGQRLLRATSVDVQSVGTSDAPHSGLVHMTDVGSAAGEAIPTPPPPTQENQPATQLHWTHSLIFAEDRETQSMVLSGKRQGDAIVAWQSGCKIPAIRGPAIVEHDHGMSTNTLDDWRWDLKPDDFSSSTDMGAYDLAIIAAEVARLN